MRTLAMGNLFAGQYMHALYGYVVARSPTSRVAN